MKLRTKILFVSSIVVLTFFAQGSTILKDNISVLVQNETSIASKGFNPYQTKFSNELIDSIKTISVSVNGFGSGVNFIRPWALPNLGQPSQIELLYFRVSCLDENNQYFEWEVSNEINNNYYEVEESADGKNWARLKRISTNLNNLGNVQKYSFTYYTQRAKMSSSTGYFYRLKLVDFSSKLSFSSVVLSDCSNYEPDVADVADVFPNPTNGIFKVSCCNFDEGSDLREIRIVDLFGHILEKRQVKGDGYIFEECFNIQNSAKGIYFVLIITKDNTIIKKIVYQ